MTEPLSIWNNNPGNLRPPKGVTYDGQIGVDEHGFAVFEKPEYGRNALVQDIRAKFKQGLTNPNDFIDKYTPASKENPEDARDNYKIHIANGLGLDSTGADFPKDSEEKVADLIASFESGKTPPLQSKKDNSKYAIPESDPEFLGRLGALGGVSAAGVIKTGQAVKKFFGKNKPSDISQVEPTLGDELPTTESPVAKVANEPMMAPEPSAQSTRIMQGGQGDTLGTTGRARQEGYNADTAQKAAIKSEMEKITPQAKQVLARMPGMTSTPSGLLIPRTEPRATAGPRPQPSALRVRGGVPYSPLPLDNFSDVIPGVAPNTMPTSIPEPAPAIPKSPLSIQPSAGEQLGQKILGALSYFSLPAKLAMTGYETGYGAQDVQNKTAKGNKKEAALSALEHGSLAASPWMGDVAALAARYGAPRLAAGISPLGLAIPAGWTLYDVYKNSYLPVSSAQAQANLARQYPDNTGNPMAEP